MMHVHPMGQHMIKPFPFAPRAAMLAGAALLAATLSSGTANAQALGYAPNDSDAFPQGYLQTPSAGAEADEDSVLPERLRRTVVNFDRPEPAGTIVIDTANTYLYYVLGGGRALRYGVGVGRQGFTW